MYNVKANNGQVQLDNMNTTKLPKDKYIKR